MDIYVEDAGSYTSISDGTIAVLQAYDGLGMSPGHQITSRGPEQHGETWIDYRLDARTIQLVLITKGVNTAALETARLELLRLLSWMRTEFVMRFVTAGSLTRHINVVSVGEPTAAMDAYMRRYQKLGVRLKAHDPTFFDPTLAVSTWSLGGGAADAMAVPTEVPTAIGGSTIDQSNNITYTGTAPSYPLIRIGGPITNGIVRNVTTGKKIDLTGVVINTGAYYDIDLRYGYQTVKDNLGANKIASLTSDSDLGTFRIMPSPVATGGVNVIRVTGDNINSLTEVTISYYLRYLGI